MVIEFFSIMDRIGCKNMLKKYCPNIQHKKEGFPQQFCKRLLRQKSAFKLLTDQDKLLMQLADFDELLVYY